MSTHWRDRAKCRELGIDPELFFDADNDHNLRDRLFHKACSICPVRLECLRENLTISDGMYGGFTRKQRYDIAEEYGIAFTRFTQFFDCSMSTYDLHQARERSREAAKS